MRFCGIVIWITLWISQFIVEVDFAPIVRGEIVKTAHDDIKPFPFMVSLQDRVDGTYNKHFCGGSLIDKNWILTAAHCVWRKKLTLIVAVIGYENISNVSEFYNVDRVEYIYFQPTNYQNDIALLHLEASYKHPELALNRIYGKLPMYGMRANRNRPCKIIGYGATRHAGQIQETLIEGEVKVITNKQCRGILGNVWAPQKGENTVCALGKQDTCQGDSGGPLICNYNGRDYIYGIVSHGLTCGIVGVPSIYTVTIPYIDWIRLIVND
ncbi:chymotrypsin-like elastase family member 1 [Teleopsis dalmanni]|uniref:chymotrypsin-like elastase family member 1 n=1 Tax=Teleopsis dalmanni TaxID=139649 RepID=UPI0018CFE648|nr:chymotrypsin-like elastase family member 1 [Teleopsis dalmanni]